MNRLIEKTLENRGLTLEKFREISSPYYGELKDIDRLAVRLKEIHDDGSVITVYPDFDMDGIASGSCLFAGLSELGFHVNLFVPDPVKGYGITGECVRDVMSRFQETKTIITCDTGIGAADAAACCRSLGVEFIVTDHHVQEAVIDSEIIVDPMRADEEYAHPKICGAFVVYQVLQYYADSYGNFFQQDQIRRLKVFAGIGTVSDSMPLLYENRQVVLDAVNIMKLIYGDGSYDAVLGIPGCNVYRRAFFGLYNVMKVCESYGSLKSPDDLDEMFFAFYFAPVFNSVKRMGGDLARAFGVFFADGSNADMDYLYKLNMARKNKERQEMESITMRDQPYAPFVYISDADGGILGLLASRLISSTGVPTFVFNDEGEGSAVRYHGSGRSPEWYPCITRLSGHMTSIAGHESAFGASIASQAQLEEFVRYLAADVNKVYSETEIVEAVPDFVIATDWSGDTGIDIQLFEDYLHELDQFRPFGTGFPEPCIKLQFSNGDVVDWKQLSNGKHLKISMHNGFDVLCWNQGKYISKKDTAGEHCIIGKLKFSEYRGVISVVFEGSFQESA